MRDIHKIVLIITVFLLPLMAETVMKITLNSSVTDTELSTLSAIVFTENAMIAGASYDLDEIQKIEFYDDGSVITDHNATHQAVTPGKIGFTITASTLSLTLSETSNLSVTLFSLNGRKVAELFSGTANSGIVDLSLANNNLATGIYSVVVQSETALFVRKIVIQ